MNTYYRLGLREIAEALRDKSLSSEGYVRELLVRNETWDARLHAWAWLDAARALKQAKISDRITRRADGSDCLRGVPVGIKDIIDTAGIPTECGTESYAGRVPDQSAAVVRKLEAAGGLTFGKTVTAELAFYTPGRTMNPWNPQHTPGGSSSGSAAAVAAGLVPAALGTQTNGSVIRPAAFCGVVGYKPSSGLISRAGIQTFSKTLDHVGVFARCVEDAAMLACCLAGFDEGDGAGLDHPRAICDPQQGIATLARPPRLGLVRGPEWHRASTAQQENLQQVAAKLRMAGAQIAEIDLPGAFDQALAMHHTIMFAEGAREFAALQKTQRARLSAPLNALIDEGRIIADDVLDEALAARLALGQLLHPLLRQQDAWLTLPAAGEAPQGLGYTGDPAFCTLWTLVGVPAISIPSGFGPQGLPLGVQLVGPYLFDARLVAVAQWCEQQLGLAPLIAELN